MSRAAVALFVLTVLGVSPVHGQVSMGAATASGITVHPPSAAPVAQPARPEPQPGHQHHVQPAARGGDLFLADPSTYAPRFKRAARGRVYPTLFPYAVGIVPYFGPHDFTAPHLYQASGASRIEGESAHGLLRLDVEPATAQVYVDGFFVGSADDLRSALSVTAGPHRLELKADGFETAAFDLHIRPNGTLRLTHTLVGAGSEVRNVRVMPDGTEVRLKPDATADVRPKPDATTLYVIPRCYAGDRRPDLSDLPAGCRIGDLRVIRPGAQ